MDNLTEQNKAITDSSNYLFEQMAAIAHPTHVFDKERTFGTIANGPGFNKEIDIYLKEQGYSAHYVNVNDWFLVSNGIVAKDFDFYYSGFPNPYHIYFIGGSVYVAAYCDGSEPDECDCGEEPCWYLQCSFTVPKTALDFEKMLEIYSIKL